VGGRPVSSWNDINQALSEAPAGPITLSFADAPEVRLDLPSSQTARMEMLSPLQPLMDPVVGAVEPGSPAEAAGVQPGDRVVAAAGEPIRTWYDFVDEVRARPGEEIELTVDRGGQQITLAPIATVDRALNDQMQRVEVGRLGIAAEQVVTY